MSQLSGVNYIYLKPSRRGFNRVSPKLLKGRSNQWCQLEEILTMFIMSESWKEAYPGAAVGILAMGHVASPKHHTKLDRQKEQKGENLVLTILLLGG